MFAHMSPISLKYCAQFRLSATFRHVSAWTHAWLRFDAAYLIASNRTPYLQSIIIVFISIYNSRIVYTWRRIIALDRIIASLTNQGLIEHPSGQTANTIFKSILLQRRCAWLESLTPFIAIMLWHLFVFFFKISLFG